MDVVFTQPSSDKALRNVREQHDADPEMSSGSGACSFVPIDYLLERRRQFLAFAEGRVESKEAAEDILQAAFVKGIETEASL